jgi:hypothetical protein
MEWQEKTPGLPGMLANLMWVDSCDFGGDPENRRIDYVYDINPAPLARLLACAMGIGDNELQDCINVIAEDDRDGPIHIVHLLVSCEYAANATGGSMYRPGLSAGPAHDLLTLAASGDSIPYLVEALRNGGFAGATAAARGMNQATRGFVLDSLLSYWLKPLTGLSIDLTEQQFKRKPTAD